MNNSKKSASLNRFCVSCHRLIQNMVTACPEFCPFNGCFKKVPLMSFEGRTDGFGRCQSCFTVHHNEWNFCEGCGLKSIDVSAQRSTTEESRRQKKSDFDIFCSCCGTIVFNGCIAKPRGCPKCFAKIPVREKHMRSDGFFRCACFKIVHKAWKYCENCGCDLKRLKALLVPCTIPKYVAAASFVPEPASLMPTLSQSAVQTSQATSSTVADSKSKTELSPMDDEFDMELIQNLNFFESTTQFTKTSEVAGVAKVSAAAGAAMQNHKRMVWDDYEDKARNKAKKQRFAQSFCGEKLDITEKLGSDNKLPVAIVVAPENKSSEKQFQESTLENIPRRTDQEKTDAQSDIDESESSDEDKSIVGTSTEESDEDSFENNKNEVTAGRQMENEESEND